MMMFWRSRTLDGVALRESGTAHFHPVCVGEGMPSRIIPFWRQQITFLESLNLKDRLVVKWVVVLLFPKLKHRQIKSNSTCFKYFNMWYLWSICERLTTPAKASEGVPPRMYSVPHSAVQWTILLLRWSRCKPFKVIHVMYVYIYNIYI